MKIPCQKRPGTVAGPCQFCRAGQRERVTKRPLLNFIKIILIQLITKKLNYLKVPGSALKAGRTILAGQKSFANILVGPGKNQFWRAFSTLVQSPAETGLWLK